MPFLGENEIRKLSVKTLAETNCTATGETRISSKKFRIRDNDIRRNYGNTILLREKSTAISLCPREDPWRVDVWMPVRLGTEEHLRDDS